jgi:hypothetical protein
MVLLNPRLGSLEPNPPKLVKAPFLLLIKAPFLSFKLTTTNAPSQSHSSRTDSR